MIRWNDVVPAGWGDLWLAEGFATYLTTVVYEQMDGEEVEGLSAAEQFYALAS